MCQETKCANGEVTSLDGICGCVCTNGFGGKDCTEVDNSCATMDLDGIKNATMGSAVKRLLTISQPKYNVYLNGTRVLSKFWARDVNCTAQNGFVTFNGETAFNESATTISSLPTIIKPPQTAKRSRRDIPGEEPLVYDTNTLDGEVLDFSRVAILYLVQSKGLDTAGTARDRLQTEFSRKVDTGSVELGNSISVDLDKKVLNLPGGNSVGKTIS